MTVYHMASTQGMMIKRTEGDWISCDAFEKGLRDLVTRVYDLCFLFTWQPAMRFLKVQEKAAVQILCIFIYFSESLQLWLFLFLIMA